MHYLVKPLKNGIDLQTITDLHKTVFGTHWIFNENLTSKHQLYFAEMLLHGVPISVIRNLEKLLPNTPEPPYTGKATFIDSGNVALLVGFTENVNYWVIASNLLYVLRDLSSLLNVTNLGEFLEITTQASKTTDHTVGSYFGKISQR